MSRTYPVVGATGQIQLAASIDDEGEMRLIIGRSDEPGVEELILAITALADLATAFAAPEPFRGAAWRKLYSAVEALHLAGRTAA